MCRFCKRAQVISGGRVYFCRPCWRKIYYNQKG